MTLRVALTVLVAAMLLASCSGNPTADRGAAIANQDLEKSGSPYRWRVIDTDGGGALMLKELIGKPSATTADTVLVADITRAIGQAESRTGGEGLPTVLETRLVLASAEERREIWVVARNEKKIAYVVCLFPSDKGGTFYRVNGPWN